MEELGITQTFWMGVLAAIAASSAGGLTYVAFHADRGFQFGIRTLLLIVSALCVCFSSVQYLDATNIWISLLFFAVSLPCANLVAIAILTLMVGYWNRSGNLFQKNKVEPYVGTVRQRPVDVVRPDHSPRRLEKK